jgi:hypothetical protein
MTYQDPNDARRGQDAALRTELRRERASSTAGWAVAAIVAVIAIIGAAFIMTGRAAEDRQVADAVESARVQGQAEGAQAGAQVAAQATADAARVVTETAAQQARQSADAAAQAAADARSAVDHAVDANDTEQPAAVPADQPPQ